MFDREKFLELINELRNMCHQNSVDHGFWDEGEEEVAGNVWINTKPWNFGEKIALIHSELSEMFEAWRKNIENTEKDIEVPDKKLGTRRMTAIEEEMADTFIRLLDLCGKLQIDVGQIILAKMEFNRSRPYMHGGRKC